MRITVALGARQGDVDYCRNRHDYIQRGLTFVKRDSLHRLTQRVQYQQRDIEDFAFGGVNAVRALADMPDIYGGGIVDQRGEHGGTRPDGRCGGQRLGVEADGTGYDGESKGEQRDDEMPDLQL